MCHEFNALLPILPFAGAAIDSEDLELTSADGTKFAAFLAKASGAGGPGVVVRPDGRGL